MSSRSRFLSTLLLGLLAACSSTPLTVEIVPADVTIDSVTADGVRAESESRGQWVAELDIDTGTARTVDVEARSRDGVTVQREVRVTGGAPRREKISMPAEVEVRIETGSAETVDIAGPVKVLGGVARRRFEYDDIPKSLTVSATSSDGVSDSARLTLEPGRHSTVSLRLGVSAAFTISNEMVGFDQDVVFDASGSDPSDRIRRYLWDFGDGETLESQKPKVVHAFRYVPARGREARYRVTLRVETADGHAAEASHELGARLEQTTLALDVDVYPNARVWIRAGDVLQIKLTPRSGFSPGRPKELLLDFGDGTSTTVDVHGRPLAVTCEEGECEPILVEHAFAQAGVFHPKLTYSHDVAGLEGPYEGRLLDHAEHPLTLVVAPDYVTLHALAEAAWADAYRQIAAALGEVGLSPNRSGDDSASIVLTALDDANFERDDAMSATLDRFTHMLVRDGYQVVERKSQVLSRLAFEAVVDIREELETGLQNASGRNYRGYLDYGLVTDAEKRTPGLFYGVKIEGTKDRITQLDGSHSALDRAQDVSAPGESAEARSNRGQAVAALQNLPILVARFDTAEHLMALKVLRDVTPAIEPDVLWDETFETTLSARSVEVALRLRLVDRRGRIVLTRDIVGKASDLVIPALVPAEPAGPEVLPG